MLEYFASLGGLSALNVIITQFIVNKFNITNGTVKQVVSWVVPILVCCVGLLFGFGMFASYGTIAQVSAWIYTILTGVAAGLISNGLYDLDEIKALLELIMDVSKQEINK